MDAVSIGEDHRHRHATARARVASSCSESPEDSAEVLHASSPMQQAMLRV